MKALIWNDQKKLWVMSTGEQLRNEIPTVFEAYLKEMDFNPNDNNADKEWKEIPNKICKTPYMKHVWEQAKTMLHVRSEAFLDIDEFTSDATVNEEAVSMLKTKNIHCPLEDAISVLNRRRS